MVAAKEAPIRPNLKAGRPLPPRAAIICRRTIRSGHRARVKGQRRRQFRRIRYEGHGPGGVAMIVERCDNRNRTASEVRSVLKFNGNLAETGAVRFRRPIGKFTVRRWRRRSGCCFWPLWKRGRTTSDRPRAHEIRYQPEELHAVAGALRTISANRNRRSLYGVRRPVSLDEERVDCAETADALDDNDDVQSVANYEIERCNGTADGHERKSHHKGYWVRSRSAKYGLGHRRR